ncbi:MAG: ATP-binding protein [Hyphomicrobiaceae bacterium]
MRIPVFASANQLISRIMDHSSGPLAQAVRFTQTGQAMGAHGRAPARTPADRAAAHRDQAAPEPKSSPLIIGCVLALALILAAVTALSGTTGDAVILIMLALLSVVGVFFLFATSVGLVQFGLGEDKHALEHLVMRSPDGIMILAPDGSVIRHNGAFADLAGGNAGLSALEAMFLVSDNGESGLFRLTSAAKVGRSAEESIHIARRPDHPWSGTYRISVATLEGEDGVDRAAEWRVIHLADTDQTRDAGLDQLTRDAMSFESLPVGMLIASPEGRILSANARLRTWTGLTNDTLENDGVSLVDLFPELIGLRDMLAPGLPGTLSLRSGSGDEMRVDTAFTRQAGNTGRIVATIREVAAVSAAPAVRLSESQSANLFSAAPIAIAVVDRSGAIESANDAFARMFGVDSTNLIASVSPDSRERVETALSAATGGDTNAGPVEIVVGEGAPRKGRVFISPAHAEGTTGDTAIVYAIDQTKQRELEAQFAQSQKMQAVGQLAGGMAHDFNNLLTVITLSSDFLLSSHQKSDPAFKDIMQIKQVAGRAAEIVKQLLAFSRQQTLLPEILSLTDEISDWTTTLRPLLGERVTLDTDNGRDLWMVKADKSQLGQVFVNLAVNARDAMPEDGQLTIRTSNITAFDVARLAEKEILPGDYVLCEVSDTGTGMPEDVREKIFDPFFSTKDVGKGTGLGLSTVYGIIKQTGGYIFCDSAPGRGTTFRIYLPRHDETASHGAVAIKEPPREKPRDMTGSGVVLLVEDEEPVRRLAARALSRQGFEVLEAGTGVEALEVIGAHSGPVDLVVSDIVMPEMDGPTLLKELRRDLPGMKLIFISGYAEDALQTLNPDEEFAFLPKPFQLADLVAKVKETLER